MKEIYRVFCVKKTNIWSAQIYKYFCWK